MEEFLNKVIIEGLGANSPDLPSGDGPVLSMNILPDKQFGFCELASVELGFAAVNCLDGVLFSSSTSEGRPYNLKISWTNDFDARKAGNIGTGPRIEIPENLRGSGGGRGGGGGRADRSGQSDNSKLGPDGVRRGPVPDSPGKIFIGGLPYNLGEEEVLQVLAAFGQVSHFHLVVDRESGMSKGYAFATYQDDPMLTCTNTALTNLNGIQLGEKSMTVKIASSSGPQSQGNAPSQLYQQQYQPPPQAPYAPPAQPAMGAPVSSYGGAPAYGAPPARPGMPYAQPGYGQPHQAQYAQMPSQQAYVPDPAAAPYGGVPYGAPPPQPIGTASYGAPPMQHTGTAAYGSYGVPSQPQVQPPIGGPGGSRVLKMSNMVTSEEIQNDAEFADIMEDVRLECSDHGAVIKVLIPRRREGYPAHTEGNIFVEFADHIGASAAKRALAGRKFDNRTVIVEDFDEAAYQRGAF